MNAELEEFIAISEEAIIGLLSERYGCTDEQYRDSRRRQPRWPFDAPVELWLRDEAGGEEYVLGTALNLSPHGVAVALDFPLDLEQRLPLAIHQPEASLHGEATVRHCREVEDGYHIGLEFVF